MSKSANRDYLCKGELTMEDIIKEEIATEEEIVFLTPMDVAKIIGCSVQAARELFYREDFPTIKVGKNFKVMKSAFIDWCRERRV